MSKKIIDPNGRIRTIHYIPNINGLGAEAYVRIGLFKKERQFAAGENVVGNLVARLEKKGWKVVVK